MAQIEIDGVGKVYQEDAPDPIVAAHPPSRTCRSRQVMPRPQAIINPIA